jgi:NADH:ubiquinone reductase (H+-translocating)
MRDDKLHRVVVIGGGFGGLEAVRKLRRANVEITLIDRRNHHLFTPLLYQVATGALSPGEIAVPLRTVFRRRSDVRVVLADVTGFDVVRRQVLAQPPDAAPLTIPYDTLIVAAGSRYSYFGHEEWSPHAPSMKTLDDALGVRGRIYRAFEAAEVETESERRAAWLTFAVVGAGPTGVELAGQIAEIARETRRTFTGFDHNEVRVLLIEHGDRALATFPEPLSAKAEAALRRLGVTPMLQHSVIDVEPTAVVTERERIPARTTIWAAGVVASPLAAALAAETGAELDRGGRITVEPDLSLPGHPEIFAIGDMVRVGETLYPGVSPVAMQQGRHVARLIRRRERHPFRYRDKGNVATIGRASAVVDLRGLHVSGFAAWVFWLALHVYYLVGFGNRLLVMARWAGAYFTRARGARLITSDGGEAPDAVIADRGRHGPAPLEVLEHG